MDVRRAKLQLFLQRICAHPILSTSPDVFVFLTEGACEVRRLDAYRIPLAARQPRPLVPSTRRAARVLICAKRGVPVSSQATLRCSRRRLSGRPRSGS